MDEEGGRDIVKNKIHRIFILLFTVLENKVYRLNGNIIL